jgi:hypothetical protein
MENALFIDFGLAVIWQQQKSESKQDTKESNTASGIKMGRINRGKGDVGGTMHSRFRV